jgi:hypothetical protein
MTYAPPEAQEVQCDVARWHTECHNKRQNRCEVDEQKASESKAESTTVVLTYGGLHRRKPYSTMKKAVDSVSTSQKT